MRGSADQLVISITRPLHEFSKRGLYARLPKKGAHTGADNGGVILLHTAIEQEKRIRPDGIQGAKNGPNVARVLGRNQRRGILDLLRTGNVRVLHVPNLNLLLTYDGENPLRVVLICQ